MVEEIKKEEGKKEGKFQEIWEKLQKEVSPVVGWAVFGGVLALAILLGFLICL